jgi:hypothetical protein
MMLALTQQNPRLKNARRTAVAADVGDRFVKELCGGRALCCISRRFVALTERTFEEIRRRCLPHYRSSKRC